MNPHTLPKQKPGGPPAGGTSRPVQRQGFVPVWFPCNGTEGQRTTMSMAIRGSLEEPKDEMQPWKAEAVYGRQLVQHFKPIFNILEMLNEIRRHFPMISKKHSCLFLGRIAF